MRTQNVRARIGPEMVALFGSSLTSDSRPGDIDVVYGGLTADRAHQIAIEWGRANRPDLCGLGIALDLHESEWIGGWEGVPGRFMPLQAVEESDPVLLIHGLIAPATVIDQGSLPRALRFYARHNRLPTTGRLRVGLGVSETQDAYFGGGLTALRTAWAKCNLSQRNALVGLFGQVLSLLLQRDLDPVEIARIGSGFPAGGGAGIDWDLRAGCWVPGTTHGPELSAVGGTICIAKKFPGMARYADV